MLTSSNPQGPAEVYPGFILAPGGGLDFYVHASGAGALDLLPPGMGNPTPASFETSVTAALAKCRSGRGDRVLCLPGHTETFTTADVWSGLGSSSDVSVIGFGEGLNRATFTWNAAASTLLMDQPNFRIRNVNMFLAGPHVNGTALTVAAPITITAAGCAITDCRIFWGFDVDQIVAIGITTTAAADDFEFDRNFCYAETAAVPTTTFLRLTGTDWLRMNGTYISGPGSTTAIGPVQQLTTAAIGVAIKDCIFQNRLAASTVAFTAIAGSTGVIDKCSFGVLAAGNGLTAASGIQVTNSKTAVAGAAGVDTTG